MDCYALLIRSLRSEDALEKGQKVEDFNPEQVRDEKDEVNFALLRRFEKKIAKAEFTDRHKQLLKSDQLGFFGKFSQTKFDPSWTLREIIEHGMADNNRTRQVCVEMGWLSKSGKITESTPEFIREDFTADTSSKPIFSPARIGSGQ